MSVGSVFKGFAGKQDWWESRKVRLNENRGFVKSEKGKRIEVMYGSIDMLTT